jgi:hypothetical protein
MALDVMPIKQYRKQLTRLLCAANVWRGDLTGYDFETLLGFLALRPDGDLFLRCQYMFAGSFTMDSLDVLFWVKPRSRRFQLLAPVLPQRQCPEFMDVCLQNCDIIKSWFCALYIILDIEYIPSIDSLPSNPRFREPADVCMVLPSFFVMCSVLSRIYRFVPLDSTWHKLTTYVVTCILPLIVAFCWTSSSDVDHLFCAFSSIVGTLNVCIENDICQMSGNRRFQVDLLPPFANNSIELKDSWKETTRCVNFENLISRKVEKIRQDSGVEEGVDARKRAYFFLAQFVDVPLISLQNLPHDGELTIHKFLMGLTIANPFSEPNNHSISCPFLQIVLNHLAVPVHDESDRIPTKIQQEVVSFCCDRVVDGVFNECPAAILGSLIPLAMDNPDKLIIALTAVFSFLLESVPKEVEPQKNILRVLEQYLAELLPLMDGDVVILVASVIFAFSLGGGKKRRHLTGVLAQSRATLSEEVRSWLQLQDLQVPPQFKTIERRAQVEDVAQAVRHAMMAQAVMFCRVRSEIKMKSVRSRTARARLMERLRDIDGLFFWAWLEKQGLFRFVATRCPDELRERVFRVVYKCPRRKTRKVKVEVGGVVGECLFVLRKEKVVILHAFDEENGEFDTVFDYVGTGCQRFNGHAVYKLTRGEITECSRGQMFQYRDAIMYILKE